MGQPKWTVEFYRKANGRCPTAEFLDSLSNEEKVFIKRSLQRLEEYGTALERPTVAPLRDHIWELRKKTHQGNIRLLIFSLMAKSLSLHTALRRNQVKYLIVKSKKQ